MNRFVALLMLVLIFVGACRKDEIPQPAQQETVAVPTHLAADSLEASHQVLVALKREYRTLLVNDSIADVPRDFGYAAPSACDHYGRAAQWEQFQQHFKRAEMGVEGVNTDTINVHFTASVRAAAKGILSIQGKFSSLYSDSLSDPYVYSMCGNNNGDLLDQISNVLDWVKITNIEPNSVGLTPTAVRKRFAEILSTEIKRDQKYSRGERWLDCKCETSIPYFYNQFRFTREELGLSQTEWKIFTEGPPPITKS